MGGGGENEALAAETGRDISDKLESVTGDYSYGSGLDRYNGNFTFNFKNGTIIKPGDYIEFSTKNIELVLIKIIK